MAITVEAVYEDGVLRLSGPLPLREQEKVRVTIESAMGWVEQSYGIIGWKGDTATLRRIAEDPEFGILESP